MFLLRPETVVALSALANDISATSQAGGIAADRPRLDGHRHLAGLGPEVVNELWRVARQDARCNRRELWESKKAAAEEGDEEPEDRYNDEDSCAFISGLLFRFDRWAETVRACHNQYTHAGSMVSPPCLL